MMMAKKGFTLIEVLVVMTLVALLVTIALPRYFTGLQRSKEAVLKEDLRVLRQAIEDFHVDKNHLPESLEALVEQRYIKFIPVDPVTERTDTWLPQVTYLTNYPQLYDVNSGAEGIGLNGVPYQEW